VNLILIVDVEDCDTVAFKSGLKIKCFYMKLRELSHIPIVTLVYKFLA
jgi:hypothetical protein